MKFIFLLSLLFATTTNAGTVEQDAPRNLVHLLDYLAADYPGAIKDGKVLSKGEYEEQVEFAEKVVEYGTSVSKTYSRPEVVVSARELQKLILAKADSEKVSTTARAIQASVLSFTNLEQSPAHWPSIKNGRAIFAKTCIACHGQTGHGDGLAGANLDPKPANFHNAERMAAISPFHSFNVIRLGVPGTGMAAFHKLSDKETWDLAFYVASLRHETAAKSDDAVEFNAELLKKTATLTDDELSPKKEIVASIRTHEDRTGAASAFLDLARTNLEEAYSSYQSGDTATATKKALIAYLEGIEPVEPRLKAFDPKFTANLEEKMSAVRAGIEKKMLTTELRAQIDAAKTEIENARAMTNEKSSSPWLTFSLAAGILLREGFEAALLLIALLGVIRATRARRAEAWLHGGWLTAVALGGIFWLFSGWLTEISGAQRELMEGSISLFAVFVLLYIGFWLHSRTEITRWKEFIDGKVKTAIEGGNLFGIAVISFLAVFREAFETVLFLRAVSLESGLGSSTPLGLGVVFAFAAVLVIAWIMLKFSAKLPLRKLFTVSSVLMIVLAVILTGKGLHAIQETGLISITTSPLNMRIELLGFFPTLETSVAQLFMLTVSYALWQYGKRAISSR